MATTAIPAKTREVRLASHVTDVVSEANFDVVEVDVRAPGDGEVVVRYDYLQVTAVMQDLMREDADLPMPTYKVGEALWGFAVGEVVASNSPDLAVGDSVQGMNGWQQYAVGPAQSFWKLDPSLFPTPQHYLTQGPTAYHGIVDIAQVREGDTVFVSGAAGGVGSLAGQIAKCLGAKRVIGSAGSQKKIDYLVNELGFDAAFNYKEGKAVDNLRRLAPDGIDVFFDVVGGEQFEAAVQAAAQDARFALCGALSGQVGDSDGAFPRLDIMTAIVRQIQIRPFATYHTPEQIWSWQQNFSTWLKEGKFVFPHTIVEGGLEKAPEALIDLLRGKHFGNVLVKLT
ncbi:NADP-dependent oxidoreductase [Lentzea sp. DG1S-22]|uniref:NADP-dependent oxidoreductase n=1 Tax=Lentzea sp. DG1S-22 TaxID=3108822 RepID=UPI002E767CEB|nr:NADP-dependent oxidoreductase [Lentzea sp. DG1S-22]WVH77295.1 NADP-dependent oxidoreductase [Lentzea sp. DG1S-22]